MPGTEKFTPVDTDGALDVSKEIESRVPHIHDPDVCPVGIELLGVCEIVSQPGGGHCCLSKDHEKGSKDQYPVTIHLVPLWEPELSRTVKIQIVKRK